MRIKHGEEPPNHAEPRSLSRSLYNTVFGLVKQVNKRSGAMQRTQEIDVAHFPHIPYSQPESQNPFCGPIS